MDEDGIYPNLELLNRIKEYDILKEGPCGLIILIEENWQWRHLIRWHPKTRILQISTGGWSGHEDIMQALKENWLFFPLYWRTSRVGGHYTFRIKHISGVADWM
jgi:hypothetical protein